MGMSMPKKIDLKKLRKEFLSDLNDSVERLDTAIQKEYDYLLIRWMSAMTSVELHGIWERYVENRLVAALNHSSKHFVDEEGVSGVKHISYGLASYIIRSGGKFFDFRSTAELLRKSDDWLGQASNPFRCLSVGDRQYIDTLAAVRNCVVHGSDASKTSYRYHLKKVYSIKYAPAPDEFLNAVDNRAASRFRYETRIKGLAKVLENAIQTT